MITRYIRLEISSDNSDREQIKIKYNDNAFLQEAILIISSLRGRF